MSTKCSCIICKNEFSIKGFHSHFVRAHTKEGNEKTKEYGKLGAIISIPKNKNRIDLENQNKEILYYKFPKYCLQCNILIPFNKKENKFCNISCSAIYNNNQRTKNDYSITEETRLKLSISTTKQNLSKPKYSKVSFCKNCNNIIKHSHNKTCSKKCYSELASKTAKNNPLLGGNKNNRAYGWYESIFAGRVWLESSYEYKVAKQLDENNINWIRPKGLPYTINNKSKTYFPDFYLVDYDSYLDPKNDYLIPQDTPKINCVIEQNNVKVFILTKTQLDWETIKSLVFPVKL